jgi:Tfp pilus assembly protein PilF
VRLAAALTGLCLAIAASAGSETELQVDQYRRAVLAYRANNFQLAADAVRNTSQVALKRVIASVSEGDRKWAAPLLEAAAMLHTDVVLRQQVRTAKEMDLQFGAANDLVERLDLRDPKQARFRQRWLALVASFFLWRTMPDLAMPYIERALRSGGQHGQAEMQAGIAEEMLAHIGDVALQDPEVIDAARVTPARMHLTFAEAHYRRALGLDESLAEAQLRLGRILYLRGESKQAREQFQAVARRPAPVRIQYLSHLFLGRAHQHAGDLTNAKAEFETALSLGPQFQTPYVALSVVESLAGNAAAARGAIERWTQSPHAGAEDPDPWSDYQNGTFDADALLWLRQQVTP